jgi:hypothetical protein
VNLLSIGIHNKIPNIIVNGKPKRLSTKNIKNKYRGYVNNNRLNKTES